jgi:RHS repeat-associated protein
VQNEKGSTKVGAGSWDVNFLLSDHLGSTSITTDDSGDTVSEMRYSPWGSVRFAEGLSPTDFTYTGQLSKVNHFGLMYYKARWYDVSLGRFAQADTIVPSTENPIAWDHFAYISNNPLRDNDPSGHGEYCGDDYDPSCLNDEEYLQYLKAIGELPDDFIIPEDLPENIEDLEALVAWVWLYNTENGQPAALLLAEMEEIRIFIDYNADQVGINFTESYIVLSPGMHGDILQTEDLAGQLAHEAYHLAMSSAENTLLEEYYAFRYQASVIFELNEITLDEYGFGLVPKGFISDGGDPPKALSIDGDPTVSEDALRAWFGDYHQKYVLDQTLPSGIK